MNIKASAVFEGGGIKGIALVGAVHAFERAGYEFNKAAGSSAGALVASLVIAGYKALEIKDIILGLKFKKFKQKTFPHFGLYSEDYFENWIKDLLLKKGVTDFSSLKGKLKVTATNLSTQKILALPDDLINFDINPKKFSVAKAVRMSAALPLFFKPSKLIDAKGQKHLIVDGGLLSNLPAWLLDDGVSVPNEPIFSFNLVGEKEVPYHLIKSRKDYYRALVSTTVSKHDICCRNMKGDKERTINIPTYVTVHGKKKYIKTTDFDLTHKEADALFENGYISAQTFLKTWDFDTWKKKFRL
jgi:NTE family protein